MTTAKGYTEMKDSGIQWIGQIPTHWLLKKAKYCVSITNGSDPKSEGSVPVYGSGSESFKTCGEYKEGPAVLIGRKGATLHIPHYIEGRYWNVDTAFDVKPQEGFSLRYYYYLACVFDYNYYISQTTLPGMTQTNYNNMKLPCPSLDEQSAIAAYLDTQCAKIDEIIAQAKASIEDYKQWKASIIYEAVTKGLNPNVEMKDSGIPWIGKIPAHWYIKVLFQLVSQVKNKNKNLSETNLLSLSYGKIKRKNIDDTDGLLPASFDGYNIIENNDIVLRLTDLQNDHTSLRVGRATERGIITSAYITVRPTNSRMSEYLYYLLHAFDIKKGFYGMGSGVRQGLNYDEIKMLKFPLPPLDEQSTIATYLDTQCAKIDDLIVEKQSLIDDLESYKKSLIYEVVTGKRYIR